MFSIIYRLQFTTLEGMPVIIHISDTTSGVSGTPVFLDLQTVEVKRKIVSDGDSKYGIKSTRIEFSFLSTSTIALKTFVVGDDQRWLVEMFFTDLTQLKFAGYLVTDDTKEKYLSPGLYQVDLTATDNLGLLREQPLTKDDGTNPRGEYSWIQYVSWILQKTGLQLPINTIYNLFPEGYVGTSAQPFSVAFQNAKMFESDVNLSEDCYTCLLMLLKGCVLVQHDGAWWILRIDEMNADDYIYYSYSYLGAFITIAGATMEKEIGLAETIQIKEAEIHPERPKLYVQERFQLRYPKEIVDNFDFSRGVTYLSPIVVDLGLFIKSYANLGAFPAAGEFDVTYKANDTGLYYKWDPAGYVLKSTVPFGKAYVFDDWTLEKIGGGSPTISTYIAKIYDPEEIQRYAVLSGGGGSHRVKSNRVPLSRNDKISFSIDRRLNSNQSGSGTSTEDFVQIRLYGEDGTFWTLVNLPTGSERVGQWIQSNSSFTLNARFLRVQYNINDTDETKWMGVNVDSEPMPVNGDVEVGLYQSTIYGTSVETHFSNMRFDVQSYINGSYQKYSAFTFKVSQPGNLRAKVEDTLDVADTTKKLLLGTISKDVSGVKIPTDLWYNFLAGTTGELGLAPFGKYQAFAEWNQNSRIMRRLEGSFVRYALTFGLPSPLHRYKFTDTSEHTDNKYFCMLSCDQDLTNSEWSGVFGEVFDTVIGKSYDDNYEFKYVT